MIVMMDAKNVNIALNANIVRSVRFAITAKTAQKRTMLITAKVVEWLVSVKIATIANGALIV